jgi:predicted O-methyltransferase YrrM
MRARELTKAFLADYAASWSDRSDSEVMRSVKAISMLGPPTLALLRLFGRVAAGEVLELGPYVGGSTVAVGLGLRDAGAGRITAVELGGAYKTHPELPSVDIMSDLDQNLRRFGVHDLVRIVRGRPDALSTIATARRQLQLKSVKLLVVDLDGCVGRDFWAYEPYMADDCLIVFDDYTSTGSDKGAPTKAFVDRAIARGLVDDLGVYEWGSWFGRLRRRPTPLERARWAPGDFLGRSGAFGLFQMRLKAWRRFGAYYPPYDM